MLSHLVSLCCAYVSWGHSQFCVAHHDKKERRQLHMREALYNTVVNFRLFLRAVWTSSHRASIALFQGNTTVTQRPPCPANGDQFPLEGHISHQPHAELKFTWQIILFPSLVHLETFWVRQHQEHSTWSPDRIICSVWPLLYSPVVSEPTVPWGNQQPHRITRCCMDMFLFFPPCLLHCPSFCSLPQYPSQSPFLTLTTPRIQSTSRRHMETIGQRLSPVPLRRSKLKLARLRKCPLTTTS